MKVAERFETSRKVQTTECRLQSCSFLASLTESNWLGDFVFSIYGPS